ncbi:hypothetical protein NQ317_007256 [Molorchus minor]|uniref:Mediator of RNA polymerase II transcription subunit 24 n=1 Tax=Molorchus minor TaxID=1323400 RepID=A0ABQ9JZH0_9CUCU|nr:hypothetical protein NQ317_007256 [Molorchus minor]
MLVAIVQNYGAAAVLDPDGDSLFEQWVRSCMVERQRPKAPEQLLRLGVWQVNTNRHAIFNGAATYDNTDEADTLMEPQLPALAYLTSYCIYTAWNSLSEDSDGEPVAKTPRLCDSLEESKPLDKLISSLSQLLNMFEGGIQEGTITQQTYFVFYLIKSLVEVKISSVNSVLTVIPPTLITYLLKTLPELFSCPLLLHVHDVCTTSGRINMARDLVTSPIKGNVRSPSPLKDSKASSPRTAITPRKNGSPRTAKACNGEVKICNSRPKTCNSETRSRAAEAKPTPPPMMQRSSTFLKEEPTVMGKIM